MDFIGNYILGALVPFLLIGIGVFFLFYLKFFFIVKPKKSFSLLFKKNRGDGISPFSAMTVALAGTLGVGNIIGVSGAMIMGGPGAVFWMIVSAFFAMVLKYAEIVLAHRHRKATEKGLCGGAMYYIEDYFGGGFGRALGSFFAAICLVNSIAMGCMLQANAVSSSFSEMSDIPPALVGLILAILCGAVIFRGVHDISPITCVIIPVMTLLYVIISLFVIFKFKDNFSNAVRAIFEGAFSYKSAGGGAFGFMFSSAVRYGCMRGLLSNEAGCGTAPIAHSASKVKLAAEQGVWGIVEVFVDTILLCTLTGLTILCVFGFDMGGFSLGEEMKLVIGAYGAAIGKTAAPIMATMVFFFAFATIICWAYYGNLILSYLTKKRWVGGVYKAFYVICILAGSYRLSEFIWQISDVTLASMTIINLVVLLLMRKEIKAETDKLF